MRTIEIGKDNFKSFIDSYDWSLLRDSDDGLFPRPFNFTAQTMVSIFGQFKTLFVFENDTIWGDYQNGQLLLIAKASGIFDTTENVVPLTRQIKT